jgi:hypothetical protein
VGDELNSLYYYDLAHSPSPEGAQQAQQQHAIIFWVQFLSIAILVSLARLDVAIQTIDAGMRKK